MALSRVETTALRGVPAAPGIGVGPVRRLAAPVSAGDVVPEERRGAAIERALEALAAAASELDELAARLRTDGRATDAEIVETGALMALDPGLATAVKAAVGGDGLPAQDAILAACSAHADVLAALPDEMLAARADDVRSLGRRAALLAAGSVPTVSDGRDFVLVAENLGLPRSPSSSGRSTRSPPPRASSTRSRPACAPTAATATPRSSRPAR